MHRQGIGAAASLCSWSWCHVFLAASDCECLPQKNCIFLTPPCSRSHNQTNVLFLLRPGCHSLLFHKHVGYTSPPEFPPPLLPLLLSSPLPPNTKLKSKYTPLTISYHFMSLSLPPCVVTTVTRSHMAVVTLAVVVVTVTVVTNLLMLFFTPHLLVITKSASVHWASAFQGLHNSNTVGQKKSTV